MTQRSPYLLRLSRFLAPKSSVDGFIKFAAYMATIHLISLGMEFGLAGQLHMAHWARLVVTLASGGPFVAASLFVFSKMEQLRTALREQARTDALTGLPNRRFFLETLRDRLGSGEGGYLLIIDADHFKTINDTYGHAAGDAALKTIAEQLNSRCRGKDNLGRIGGEEFAMFLGRSTEREVDIIAGRLLEPIVLGVDECPENLTITLSIGAAQSRSGERVSAFMHRADEALYLAKSAGRARMMHWEHRFETLVPTDSVPPRRRAG